MKLKEIQQKEWYKVLLELELNKPNEAEASKDKTNEKAVST